VQRRPDLIKRRRQSLASLRELAPGNLPPPAYLPYGTRCPAESIPRQQDASPIPRPSATAFICTNGLLLKNTTRVPASASLNQEGASRYVTDVCPAKPLLRSGTPVDQIYFDEPRSELH